MYYIILGYLLKVLIYAIKTAFGKDAVFSLFTDTGIPWYMFAMAAYMVIAYVIRKKNPKVCLPVSVILALLAGYVDGIGSFLYISRILVVLSILLCGISAGFRYCSRLYKKEMASPVRGCSACCRPFYQFFTGLMIFFSIIRMFTGRKRLCVYPCGRMRTAAPSALLCDYSDCEYGSYQPDAGTQNPAGGSGRQPDASDLFLAPSDSLCHDVFGIL